MKKVLIKAFIFFATVAFFSNCNDSKKISIEESKDKTTDTIFVKDTISRAEKKDCCMSVSLDKMNVFYLGVDNPITINAPFNCPITISENATISKAGSANHFNLRVQSGVMVSIGIKNPEDTTCVFLNEFRVKRVPDPVAYVGGIKGDGTMSKAEAANIRGVFARMENFDLDVRFNIVSFVLSMNINGVYIEKRASGPGVTGDMSGMLLSVRSGSKILFEQITVSGPDGTLRKIPGVIIKVR